ncbi:hypothetical protein DSBG_1098 [Desulfosporosinus sp. BG]|nr:hypothetical protein DSBG_1098 [Desulfosporosinus sp. BG]
MSKATAASVRFSTNAPVAWLAHLLGTFLLPAEPFQSLPRS